MALLSGHARAQDAAGAPTGRLPSTLGRGATAIQGTNPAASGSSGTLSLPPGLTGNDPDTPATVPGRPSAQQPTSGAGRRPGLRDNRARRSRSPVADPVQGGFRATLAPQAVVPNVQPPQTGVPDAPVPAVPPRRRPLLAAGTVATVPSTQSGLADPALGATAIRPAPPVDDPYGPLGIRAGSLLLRPVFGESIGYDSNPNRTSGGAGRRGSFVSLTEGELGVQSNWSQHELSGFLRGAYDAYPGNPQANRPEGSGRLGLRLDVLRDTQVDVEGHYQIDTQRPGNPNLLASVRERPIVYTEGASAGVTQRFNRVQVSLRGSVDRTDYEDAALTDGTILSQRDRNFTDYGLRARLGYELTPALVPFVEAGVDTRQYDLRTDSSGYRRTSDGVTARLGTSFELSRLLTGEISAGGSQRQYRDPRLGDLTSPVADASLTYALSPLTTVRAIGAASIDETTVPGANGIRSLRGGLEVSHQLRRNLTVTAGINASDYEYQGVKITEQGFGALVRADYRLNRWLALRASYTYDTLHSTVAGSSYAASVFLLGMRFTP